MATAAAASAATAAAVAKGAFSYNRANYMFDQGHRFGRYTSGYSFAQAQAAQYREDIRDLSAHTCAKQDTYHVVGVIFFVLSFQLIMAGRLGVHGPSPPGWLLGLYWTNICSAICYLVTFTWTSLHASARATSGAAYMLTRNVRLPIPSPKQLDKARRTGNSYEKQRMSDVFRVPFVAPAPKDKATADDDEADVEAGTRRMPHWYLGDEVSELHGGEGLAPPSDTMVPDHFALYQGLQQEWFGHDCYARVGMLFFISHWLAAANIFQMCHCFTELRAMWPAWSCCAMFCTAHYTILTLDIQGDSAEVGFSLPMEKIVPFMPVLCVLGMSIDYSVLSPHPIWEGIIYGLSWICYFVYLAFEIRLFSLAMPTDQKEDNKIPGRPAGWLPAAFSDMVYIVAPPSYSEPGQICLQQEMRAGRKGANKESPPKKARAAPFGMFPWKIFRGANITAICMWCFIICGRAFENFNGERALMKQEGRMERWPSHVQPWMAPWTRSGEWETRQSWCHAGGCDRRLSGAELQEQQRIMNVAQRVTGALNTVAHLLDTPIPAPTPLTQKKVAMIEMHTTNIAWPEHMRPKILAAHSTGHVVALGHGHSGAMVRMVDQALNSAGLSSFKLHGIEHLGEVLGANWGEHGLLLTMTSGGLTECAGLPESGIWNCHDVQGLHLPSGGASLEAASAVRVGKLLRAVVRFAGETGLVLLEREAHKDAAWLPAGEIRMPRHMAGRPHLSLTPTGEELHMTTGNGGVMKWTFGRREPEVVAAPAKMPAATAWHGCCHMGGGQFAHLATAVDGVHKLLLTHRTA